MLVLYFLKILYYKSVMESEERKERRRAMPKDRLMGAFVDKPTREAIRRAAFEEDVPMAAIIRRAIEEYLARRKGKKR